MPAESASPGESNDAVPGSATHLASQPPEEAAPTAHAARPFRVRFSALVPSGPGPSLARALAYLGIGIAFGAALLASMLLGGTAAGTAAPCTSGAVIAQAAQLPDPAGTPHLFAVVRPPALPNVALGNEPGCQALFRSDDNGLTWTVVFSATAEAPASVLPAGPTSLYLLTQRMQFPLYLAGNLYRSDSLGAAWTWNRISPQGRHAVPVVSATDMMVGDDGSVILHEGNGDGAALVRSTDGGATWQPLVIPNMVSAASMAQLGSLIAVTPSLFTPGRSPGMVSADGGGTWLPLGDLPHAPKRHDLRPLLAGDPVEQALILSLVPRADIVPDHPVTRYVSLNGGLIWSLVHCGARPAPGCAPPSRWAQGAADRYVLYHRRIFRARPGSAWLPLPNALPVRSDAVLQLLASPSQSGDQLYLVTATGIWHLGGGRWQSASSGLALGGPTPTEG